ncbi:MAG: hypothetical protein NZT92_20385 [Abditibacteriales bacterium]|nr:hypothetical protein [Abditibacteriales bacterium]MDW8364968.1 hypothetical protein [Abditibacteriales bacterium]
MGYHLTMVMGALFILIGIGLWFKFWGDFINVLKGVIGFTLFFVGLVAFVIGWSERRAPNSEFDKATTVSPPVPETAPPTTTSAETKN